MVRKFKIAHLILAKISVWIGLFFRISQSYRFEDLTIKLPPGHLLKYYKKFNPRYDGLLPQLVRTFGESDVVIDVGANVGDSLAAMISKNSKCRYICIEPDPKFFSILVSNSRLIQDFIPTAKVLNLNNLIGTSGERGSLSGSSGTKRAFRDSAGEFQYVSLDDLFMGSERVRLIKSDVDGFDYDVIKSGFGIISRHHPLIFFECQFSDAEGHRCFNLLLDDLNSLGYCKFFIFDNFGGLILQTSDLHVVRNLLRYLLLQETNFYSRTIYYFDILCAHSGDNFDFDSLICKYNSGHA